MSESCTLLRNTCPVEVMLLDTCAVKCRHASLRRFGRARSQTHAEKVARMSADFLLMRQRQEEHRAWRRQMAAGATVAKARSHRSAARKRQGWLRGRQEHANRRCQRPRPEPRPIHRGAGAHRLVMSRFLRGRSMKTSEERTRAFRAANEEYKKSLATRWASHAGSAGGGRRRAVVAPSWWISLRPRPVKGSIRRCCTGAGIARPASRGSHRRLAEE